MRRRLALALVCVVAAAVGLAAGATAADPPKPHVTVFADSVASTIELTPGAMRLLGRGVDTRFEGAVCRRLSGVSCPHDGVRPPTVLDLVTHTSEPLGATVVVAVGHNVPADEYAASIEAAVSALRRAGVERVLWVTLRAVRHPYLTMNEAVAAAAERHPGFTVVDWNELSRTHPEWFADDGLHPAVDGARALAALVRRSLGEAGAAPPVRPLASTAPERASGRVGVPFRARLTAQGGEPGYRWKRVAGALPGGLSLTTAGVLVGTPRADGRFRVTVRVTDAVGAMAEWLLELSISR